MASLDMEGPCILNADAIDSMVTKTSAGNYALGHINKANNHFIVEYIGRADTDVNERLKQHIREEYDDFKYSYASSPKAAFEKECKNYHEFGGPDGKLNNKIHPDRPEGTSWKCPYCNDLD